jgi:hypothetical protein
MFFFLLIIIIEFALQFSPGSKYTFCLYRLTLCIILNVITGELGKQLYLIAQQIGGIVIMVYTLWCIHYGVYIMVYILWCIHYGVYIIVYILWCIHYSVYMLWCLYYGLYIMVCILWCIHYGVYITTAVPA